MYLDEGAYKPTPRGDILHYYQALINQLKEIDKLVTDSFHNVFLVNKDFKDHDLQPGDLVHCKRHQLKTLQPSWKGPYQVLLN